MGGVIPTLTGRVPGKGERERTVRLITPAPRPPGTALERLVVTTLTREGAIRFGTLVDRVAVARYLDELRRGAWVVDIGLFGHDLFVPEVARELEAAKGILWELETPERTP